MSHSSHVGMPEWLTLESGERIRVHVRPSKNLLLATFVVGTALLLGLGVVATVLTIDVETGRAISSVVLLFVFVLTGSVYLVTRRREYVVTSERIYEAVGLTSKNISTVELDDVRDVAVEQSNWQTWLDVGSLRFDTEDETTIQFDFVEKPQRLYERTVDSVERIDHREE